MVAKASVTPSVNFKTNTGVRFLIVFEEMMNRWETTHEDMTYTDANLAMLKEKLNKLTSAQAKKFRLPAMLFSRGRMMKVTCTSLLRYGYVQYTWKDKDGSTRRDRTGTRDFYADTPANDVLYREWHVLKQQINELEQKAEAVTKKMKAADFTEMQKVFEGVI
jgi:hypothetical protein